MCTVPAWGISKNGIIIISSDYRHLSKSEVDACTTATIGQTHNCHLCGSQVVWVTDRWLQGMATWTRSSYLPQERGYHVHVIWQYAVQHQRKITGAQYKDYKIDWTRHKFVGWADTMQMIETTVSLPRNQVHGLWYGMPWQICPISSQQ